MHPTHTQAEPDWRIEWYGAVGSTNDMAKERARAGEPRGLVLVADEQASGRGRLGRSWVAPARSSLLVSVLLRPFTLLPESGNIPPEQANPDPPEHANRVALPAEQAYRLTMLAAVALCEAVESVMPIQAALKWPNDLMLSGQDGKLRKSAGILAEVDIRHGGVAWVVLGFGVNISWHPVGVVDGRDLGQQATSLYAALGRPIPVGEPPERKALLHALLARIAAWQSPAPAYTPEQLYATWRNRLTTIGQRVTIQLPDRQIEGVAEDVDPHGSLLVRDESGRLQIVTTGEVRA